MAARPAQQWIETLGMRAHPEGGWFSEFYRSPETISRQCLPGRFTGPRRFSTAIYFLLREGEFSALHRIRQDELWHFYCGVALTVHVLDPDGAYSTIRLGTDLEKGERPLAVVPAGCYFGADLSDPGAYALAGCTVSPGFTFEDFEMPGRDVLLQRYPQHEQIVTKLTRE